MTSSTRRSRPSPPPTSRRERLGDRSHHRPAHPRPVKDLVVLGPHLAGAHRLRGSAPSVRCGPRVVLATAHADGPTGNLAAIRRSIARRAPAVRTSWRIGLGSGVRPGFVGALAGHARPATTSRRRGLFMVDDYFFPIYVDPAAEGTHDRADLARLRRVQALRLQPARQDLRRRRGPLRPRRIHSNYDLCLVSALASLRHTPRHSAAAGSVHGADIGIPRTDILFGDERIARDHRRVRAGTGFPTASASILYAPTFRGDSVHARTVSRGSRPRACARRSATDHVVLVRLHPFVRDRAPIPVRRSTASRSTSPTIRTSTR